MQHWLRVLFWGVDVNKKVDTLHECLKTFSITLSPTVQ